jgi:multicomponent Na+:H+ antiporter subunit D
MEASANDYRLLLALLVPLLGTLGVMIKGNNENVREGISSVASIILLLLVASMIAEVRQGKILIFTCSRYCLGSL